jgi:hypothetical protein
MTSLSAQAASRDGGGELQRLQWAAPTGTDTFAVPKDHKDLMRHLRVVMLRGVPETALAVDDRTKTSSSIGILSAIDNWGRPRMKADNHRGRVWEEYATYRNYLCPACTEGRQLVVRPPFDGMALLRPTNRVSAVPDNRPTALRLVFTAVQRDKLIACGYEQVIDIVPHLPSDRLLGFEETPTEPTRKRRARTSVASAGDIEPAGYGERAEDEGQDDSRSMRPKPAPTSGAGVDALTMPVKCTIPDYKTPQELCNHIELGYYQDDVYISPMYRWPKNQADRRKWMSVNGVSSSLFKSFNNNYENRLKEYYNLLENPTQVYERMKEGPAKTAIGDKHNLDPTHACFFSVTIPKDALRLAYPDSTTSAIQRVRSCVQKRCETMRREYLTPFDTSLP